MERVLEAFCCIHPLAISIFYFENQLVELENSFIEIEKKIKRSKQLNSIRCMVPTKSSTNFHVVLN